MMVSNEYTNKDPENEGDICDRILENHPYERAWNKLNFWVYHNLADITKHSLNISTPFLVIQGIITVLEP